MSSSAGDITEETLAQIAKAQTTGILESTGIYSYDLSGLVTLIPVVTPFRDIVPRKQSPDGNPFAVWRAIMNLTNSQPDPSMGFDYAANETVFLEQDFQARYKPTGLAGLVTQDAFDLGKGYGDPYAIATFNVLNQVLIADDRKLMGAQSFPLAAADGAEAHRRRVLRDVRRHRGALRRGRRPDRLRVLLRVREQPGLREPPRQHRRVLIHHRDRVAGQGRGRLRLVPREHLDRNVLLLHDDDHEHGVDHHADHREQPAAIRAAGTGPVHVVARHRQLGPDAVPDGG